MLCTARAFSLSAARVTPHTHLFLFYGVCSAGADSVGRGRPPFISFYHLLSPASRRVGISPLSSKYVACLPAPQHPLYPTRPHDVKLSSVAKIRRPPPLSHAPTKGRLISGEQGTANRQARRKRTNVFKTLSLSGAGRTRPAVEELFRLNEYFASVPSFPPGPVPRCSDGALDLRAFTAMSSAMASFNGPLMSFEWFWCRRRFSNLLDGCHDTD